MGSAGARRGGCGGGEADESRSYLQHNHIGGQIPDDTDFAFINDERVNKNIY